MADTELLPCPFCGVELAHERDDGMDFYDHPSADCIMSGTEIEGDRLHAWNRRATPPSPSTAPEAWVYECKQPHTDPVIWSEFFSRDKPSDAPYIRNARPLYGSALASRPAEVGDAGAGPGGQMAVEQAETRMDAGFQPVAVVAQEVDDEGLPSLPAPDHEFWDYHRQQHIRTGGYTPQQYRQGQRDAVAADRARREVGGKIPRESNDALIKLAKYWKLDGDWMTCRACRRSLIASRDGEELNHGDGCKFWDQQHPWAQLRGLIARQPTPAESGA